MFILGIETSCDETAAAVLEAPRPLGPGSRSQSDPGIKSNELRVMSNAVASQIKIHRKYGGVVPEVAARNHILKILPVFKKAVGSKIPDVIAVTTGPGLMTSLSVGVETARALAYSWKKPVVAINHLEAHIYSNWLLPIGEIRNSKHEIRNNFQNSKFKIQKFSFPMICLIASGGHTSLVLMKKHLQYKVIGETLDDAAGEAFDKIAKILGLGYPGGPAIAAEAAKIPNYKSQIPNKFQYPNSNTQIRLPRPMIDSGDFNFSFSGLKTAVLYTFKNYKKISARQKTILAASAQQAIVDVLVEKTIRAAKQYKVKTVLLAGGVAANQLLRVSLKERIKKDLPLAISSMPLASYCTDNAAMVAAAGYFYAKRKNFTPWEELKPKPNLRLNSKNQAPRTKSRRQSRRGSATKVSGQVLNYK